MSAAPRRLSGKLLAALLILIGIGLGAVADRLRREQRERLPVESERLRAALLTLGPELADDALARAIAESDGAAAGSCTPAEQFDVASSARDWLDVRLRYRCELTGQAGRVTRDVWYPVELERSGDTWVRAGRGEGPDRSH